MDGSSPAMTALRAASSIEGRMTRRDLAGALCLGAAAWVPAPAGAAEEPYAFTITIRDHRFDPAEIRVPANRRLLITVVNEDEMSEEFESAGLKAEKVIAAKSQGTVRVGRLDPGRYAFIGEYHAETAKGVIIAE